MRNSLIAALALTVGCGGGAAIILAVDPDLTPLRIMGLMGLLSALGISWGRAIWDMRQR
jgi:hypothetical protein